VDQRGHVRVNERLETTAKGIWAVGDCAGSPYFTHIAENDFSIVLANLSGGNRTTTGRQVPFCLFTDPELARVGLNEREAKERGIRYRLAKIPMSGVFRALTISETRGFLKASSNSAATAYWASQPSVRKPANSFRSYNWQ